MDGRSVRSESAYSVVPQTMLDAFTRLQALSAHWLRKIRSNRTSTNVYEAEQVYQSLNMAANALQAKNQVINGLEMKLALLMAARSGDDEVFDAVSPTASSAILTPPAAEASGQHNASIMTRLQDTASRLERAEAASAAKDAEIARLLSLLATAETHLAEAEQNAYNREATVAELAHMLASREASHVALVETVQSFIGSQSSSSSPPDAATSTSPSPFESRDPVEAARHYESSVCFWQERLEAQARLGAAKLRDLNLSGLSSGNNTNDVTPGTQAEPTEPGRRKAAQRGTSSPEKTKTLPS